MWLNDMIHDDEYVPIPFKLKGPGIGHAANGKRQSWIKDPYFDGDLLSILEARMSMRKFKARFIHTPSEIRWFFDTIKENAVRPLETMHHSRNKFLLFLDRVHNCLSGEEMSDKFRIGCKTAYDHCAEITKAILLTYGPNTDVISFPTMLERKKMSDILRVQNRPIPSALFAVDGSDTRCTGRHINERLSFKYGHHLPCFKVTFIGDRLLGSVCAVNIEPASTMHDIKTLRRSVWFQSIEKTMNGSIILADKVCSL